MIILIKTNPIVYPHNGLAALFEQDYLKFPLLGVEIEVSRK